MDSTDSWENILSELDLTDHRQDLAAAGYDSFKARAVHSDISFKVGTCMCSNTDDLANEGPRFQCLFSGNEVWLQTVVFPSFCESCGPETSGQALMNMLEADMDRFSFPLDSLIETQKVFQFLKGARLEKFAEKFIELGFSTMEDLKHMSDSDLLKCGVGQPGHQNRFASQKQQHFRPDHVEPLPVPSASMEGGHLSRVPKLPRPLNYF